MAGIYGSDDGYDAFDFAPGRSVTFGGVRWPCFPHSDGLRSALFCTYYKEDDLAYQKIGELYNEYCLAAHEEPLTPYPVRHRWAGIS